MAESFKQAGYRLELVFFCLDAISKAKERVRIRVENGGHFVPDHEIEKRYKLGYENLNENWKFFDTVHLFDTSQYNHEPRHLLTTDQQKLVVVEDFPEYLHSLIPSKYLFKIIYSYRGVANPLFGGVDA